MSLTLFDQIRNACLPGACALAVMLAGSVLAEDQMDFMPPGGKTILVEQLGEPDAAKIAELAATTATTEEWLQRFSELLPDIGDNALATVAGYSAVNFPLSPEALARFQETGDPAEALPPDGKELAINNCQNCHSLFSGYLTHDRDATGWLGVFKSPFHSEIPMTEKERETFSRYSETNMPLRIDDVPPAYRF